MKTCGLCKKKISNIYDMNKTPSGLIICNSCFPEWERLEMIRLSHKKLTKRNKRSSYTKRRFNK